MAAGFRSAVFLWVGGIGVPTGITNVCPCPEYGVDPTLYNQFIAEGTISNQFIANLP